MLEPPPPMPPLRRPRRRPLERRRRMPPDERRRTGDEGGETTTTELPPLRLAVETRARFAMVRFFLRCLDTWVVLAERMAYLVKWVKRYPPPGFPATPHARRPPYPYAGNPGGTPRAYCPCFRGGRAAVARHLPHDAGRFGGHRDGSGSKRD